MTGGANPPTPQGWTAGDRIGTGSSGCVYRIIRQQDGARAALKVISIPCNEDEIPKLRSKGYDNEAISRLFEHRLIEIYDKYDIIKKMSGEPNIVRIDDVTYLRRPDGSGCEILIRMEELTPLGRTLERDYTESKVVAIANGVLSALERYEQYHLLHGSIKPENILVSKSGECKLSDFGVSDLLGSQSAELIGGACDFMAPEVFLGKEYDNRADIYSVGMLIYWLCNNYRIPFLPPEGSALSDELFEDAIARRVSGGVIPDPVNGSTQLKQIIAKACSYDPQNRYRSASAMRADLGKLLPQRKAQAPIIPMTRLDTNSMRPYAEPMMPERKPVHVPRDNTAVPTQKESIRLFEDDLETTRARSSVFEATAPAKKKKKKNGTTAIVAAISGMVLIAAACVAVALIVMMTKDDKKDKDLGATQTNFTNVPMAQTVMDTPNVSYQTQASYAPFAPGGSLIESTPYVFETNPPQIEQPPATSATEVYETPTETPTPKPTNTPKPTPTPKPTVAPAPEKSFVLNPVMDGVCMANSNCHLRSEWTEKSYDFGKIDRAQKVKILAHHPTQRWTLIQYKNKEYWVFDGYIFGDWMIPSNDSDWNTEFAKFNHGIYDARSYDVTMPETENGDKLLSKPTYYFTQQSNTTMWKKYYNGSADESNTKSYYNISKKGDKVIILYERTVDEYGDPMDKKWYFCAYHEQTEDHTTTYFGWINENYINSKKP